MREHTSDHCARGQMNGTTSCGWKRVRAYIIVLLFMLYYYYYAHEKFHILRGSTINTRTYCIIYTITNAIISLSQAVSASVCLFIHSNQRDFRQMSTPSSYYSRLKSNTLVALLLLPSIGILTIYSRTMLQVVNRIYNIENG